MTLILSCVHLDDFLVVSSPLSVASTWVCRRNRHVNTGIYVRLCGNKVLEKKSVWLFCGLDDEVVRWGEKKSEVKSSRVCLRIGSCNRDGNPVSLDHTSFHSLSLYII